MIKTTKVVDADVFEEVMQKYEESKIKKIIKSRRRNAYNMGDV